MAQCRCEDIEWCENRIKILLDTQHKFTAIDQYMQSIKGKQESLSKYYPSAFVSTNIVRLCRETEEIIDAAEDSRQRIAERIASGKNQLQRQLISLRSEDERHHYEEQKKAEEEAERQRQLAVMRY